MRPVPPAAALVRTTTSDHKAARKGEISIDRHDPWMALHTAVEERLARLAPDQRAAATAPPGPVLCVAPAGSGKTTTLVARICWLVASGVDPTTITAVTFNRRAAEELSERLTSALAPLQPPADLPRVRTFHALGREVLAQAGVDVSGLVDRTTLLGGLFPDAPASVLRRLDDVFSRLKLNARLEPTALATMEREDRPRWLDAGGASAFLTYEAALRERGALDFDDLVVRALELLAGDPALLGLWRQRCAHLLVDEVQDVDRTQLDLAVLLAGPERHIFLVGDDDQTIYAWRLADVRRVILLAERLPGLRRVDLTVNYRCPAPVVQRAVRLVAHNRERFRKRIAPRTGAEGQLLLAALPTDDATRARRVLRRWVGEGLADARAGTRWAVLARTNAELAPFAAVALEMGVPFSADDHGLLLDDPRVDELLDAAESVAGPSAHPLPAIGRLRAAGLPDPPGESGNPPHPASEARDPKDERAGQDPLIASLLAWAAPFPTLLEFRRAIAVARRRLARLQREDAPLVLATVHGTKGLEFDHVAVVGLDEGRFPSRRSLEESENPGRALEEERRLAYVAWTRAKRSLVLVYDPGAPSPFLREAFTGAELAAG